jgi:hypothetical protein
VSAEDPVRFRESGSSGPAELRALFQAGTEDLPSDAQLAALAAKLGPVLTGAGLGAAGAGLPTKTKLGVAALGAAGAGVLAWALLSGREAPAPVKPAATAVQSRTAPTVTPSGANEPPVATAPSGVPAPNGAGSSSETAPSTVRPAPPFRPAESEAEFLERARGALGQSPAAALSLANQHRARFPAGVLAEEREVIAIEALKRLGRTAEAERRVEAFARRFPGSAYRKKLEAGAGR